jgi:hypothetical protein
MERGGTILPFFYCLLKCRSRTTSEVRWTVNRSLYSVWEPHRLPVFIVLQNQRDWKERRRTARLAGRAQLAVPDASCLPAAVQRATAPRYTTQISSEPNFTDCLSPLLRVGSLSQNYTELYVYTPGWHWKWKRPRVLEKLEPSAATVLTNS